MSLLSLIRRLQVTTKSLTLGLRCQMFSATRSCHGSIGPMRPGKSNPWRKWIRCSLPHWDGSSCPTLLFLSVSSNGSSLDSKRSLDWNFNDFDKSLEETSLCRVSSQWSSSTHTLPVPRRLLSLTTHTCQWRSQVTRLRGLIWGLLIVF